MSAVPATTTRAARVLAALLLAVLAVALGAGPASAHAQLVETSPLDGSDVPSGGSYDAVTLTFDEPVTSPPDAIRVFDGGGNRVDDGATPTGAPEVLGVAVGDLADGPYVVTWRAVSGDGHPLRGAFVFTVGGTATADAGLVASLFAGGDGPFAGLLTGTTALTYVAVLLLAGAALVGRRLDLADRGARLVRAAAIAGVVLTAVSVPLQAAVLSGDGLAAMVDPAQLGSVLGQSVGLAAIVRLVALVGVLVGRGPVRLGTAGLALLSFVVDGHTRTVDPAWLVVGADVLHLAAGAVWLGGLALLVLAMRDRRLDDDPRGGARLVAGWSSLATLAIGGVVVAGSALSWATVRSPAALTSTTYGQLLMVKLGLAGLVVAIGAWNHFRLVPAVERAVVPVPAGGAAPTTVDAQGHADEPPATATTEHGWSLLRRLMAVEVVVLVAVLGVTGALTTQRPAAEAAGLLGSFQTSVALTDEYDLDLVVDPNVAGLNSMHLYLLDQTGRPVDALESLELQLSLPDEDLGPIVREPLVSGPGHWVLTGNELALPGRWEITVVARVSRFEESTVTIPVLVGGS